MAATPPLPDPSGSAPRSQSAPPRPAAVIAEDAWQRLAAASPLREPGPGVHSNFDSDVQRLGALRTQRDAGPMLSEISQLVGTTILPMLRALADKSREHDGLHQQHARAIKLVADLSLNARTELKEMKGTLETTFTAVEVKISSLETDIRTMATALDANDVKIKSAVLDTQGVVDKTVAAVKEHFDRNSAIRQEFDAVKSLLGSQQMMLQRHHEFLSTMDATGRLGSEVPKTDLDRGKDPLDLGSAAASASMARPPPGMGAPTTAAFSGSSYFGPPEASADPLQSPLHDAWARAKASAQMGGYDSGPQMGQQAMGGAMPRFLLPTSLDREVGGTAGRTLFSEKVALTKDVQYDGVKNGPGWKLTTSNYFISKAPDLEHILQLIETQEDVPVSTQSLSQVCRTTTMPARISQLSSEI